MNTETAMDMVTYMDMYMNRNMDTYVNNTKFARELQLEDKFTAGKLFARIMQYSVTYLYIEESYLHMLLIYSQFTE
jgi:hypothetical protein